MNTENKAMIKDGKEVCPCCDRHCPVDNLHCPNGKEHFGLPVEENEKGRSGHGHGARHEHDGGHGHGGMHGQNRGPRPIDKENMTTEELTMALLRQCGHFLHHNVGHGDVDCGKMFAALTEEEKTQLNILLEKCLAGWKELAF